MATFNVKINQKQLTIPVNPGKQINEHIYDYINLLSADYYLTENTFYVQNNSIPITNKIYSVHIKQLGGKGGFGNMLRAVGLRMTRSSNEESCRNLSGRRILDVENQKRYVKYMERRAKMEEECKERRAEKRRKMQEEKIPPKLEDEKYFKDRKTIRDGLADAVEEGLKRQKVVSTAKRMRRDDDLGSDMSSDESIPEELSLSSPETVPWSPEPCEVVVELAEEIELECPPVDEPVEVEKVERIVVEECEGVDALEGMGLVRLKGELLARGVKCGGTGRERAERLWAVRGLQIDQIDKKLLAKK